MNLPLITDWQFYAAAIPAVLLLGLSKSGFGAGFGSLAVPIMALTVTVPQAAAILLPILFVMDVMGLAAYRGKWDAKLLRFLIPMGLLGTVFGTLSFPLLNANIVRATLAEPLAAVIEKRGLKSSDIDWFLPHLSSNYFVEPVSRCLDAMGFSIPRERWFSNLARKGNTGSASPYIMLDELFRSGRIRPGHKLLMFVPESGRFSSGFIHMEAV